MPQQQTKQTSASAERAKLLASRPDFGPELRAALAKAPIAKVRELVKTLPRKPSASRPDERVQGYEQPAASAAFADFDQRWKIGGPAHAVTRTSTSITCSALGTPQPSAARRAGTLQRTPSTAPPSAAAPIGGASLSREAIEDMDRRMGLHSQPTVKRSQTTQVFSALGAGSVAAAGSGGAVFFFADDLPLVSPKTGKRTKTDQPDEVTRV